MLRAILLNDTRPERHLGCVLVVETILAETAATGINILESFFTHQSFEALQTSPVLEEIDLMLVNGEGSMHDDAPRAIAIMQAAMRAKMLGKKVVLYNTVWDKNDQLNTYLKYCDAVYARETYSQNNILPHFPAVKTCPDLTFGADVGFPAQPTPQVGDGKLKILCLDSVYPEIAVALAEFSLAAQGRFYAMSPYQLAAIKIRRDLKTALEKRMGQPLSPADKTLFHELNACDIVVTGRFHGACLAMLFNKPFLAVGSNTCKVEGLIHDATLPASWVLTPAQLLSSTHAELLTRTESIWTAFQTDWSLSRHMQDYIETARQETKTMFRAFSDLLRIGTKSPV